MTTKLKSYALTLKWNTNPNPTRMDYMQCISDLLLMFNKILVYNWCYEADSQNKLHLHAHIKCKYIHWNKYLEKCNQRGFHVNVQELKTESDQLYWDAYLDKQRLSVEECEQMNIMKELQNLDYPFI